MTDSGYIFTCSPPNTRSPDGGLEFGPIYSEPNHESATIKFLDEIKYCLLGSAKKYVLNLFKGGTMGEAVITVIIEKGEKKEEVHEDETH